MKITLIKSHELSEWVSYKDTVHIQGKENGAPMIHNHTMPHIRRNPLVIRRKEIKTLQSAPPFLLVLV